MPLPEQHNGALQRLVALIDRAGLRVPVSMMLDALHPLDFVSSQVALFCRPFTAGSAWERYTVALTDEAGWQELRQLLGQHTPASGDGHAGSNEKG